MGKRAQRAMKSFWRRFTHKRIAQFTSFGHVIYYSMVAYESGKGYSFAAGALVVIVVVEFFCPDDKQEEHDV